MASASEDHAVQIAIEVCTRDEFKSAFIKVSNDWLEEPEDFKERWNKKVEEFLYTFFENEYTEINDETKAKVVGIVFSIALRMLTWTEYHVRTFDFDHDFCLSFLTREIFIEKGVIDYNKTVRLALNDGLSIEQRFRLASWHCLKDICTNIFSQLDENVKKFYIENKVKEGEVKKDDDYIPVIMHFWANYVTGNIQSFMDKKLTEAKAVTVGRPGKRKTAVNPEMISQSSRPVSEEDIKRIRGKEMKGGLKNILQSMLEHAILSGSKTAVKYCIDEIRANNIKTEYLLDALIKLVIQRMDLTSDLMGEMKPSKKESRNYVDDWVAFRYPKYTKKETWLPNHFIVDLFYFIFSEMSEEEKMKIAPKLEDAIKNKHKVRTSYHKELFSHFLCWPYQEKLMEFVNLCWDYIPLDYFGTLLFNIIDRIEPPPDSLYYGENMSFDYKRFFEEFLNNSPEKFKRYIFKDRAKEEKYFQLQDKTKVHNVGKMLLQMNIKHNVSPATNSQIAGEILNHAKPSEREKFISYACNFLIETKNDKYFYELVSLFEEPKKQKFYMRKFESFEKCLGLIKDVKFTDAENELSSLGMHFLECYDMKEKIIFSVDGIKLLQKFGFEDGENFKTFVEWSKIPERKAYYLGNKLLDTQAEKDCALGFIENPEIVDRFLDRCVSLSELSNPVTQIKTFKQRLFSSQGTSFCDYVLFHERHAGRFEMEGRLEFIDEFLNWCFIGVEEDEKIKKCGEFKRDLVPMINTNFHYQFIKSSRFNDATLFFEWAGLDTRAIEIEKKKIFCECFQTIDLFVAAVHEKDIPPFQEEQKQFIRDILEWCLVDSVTLNNFATIYRNLLGDEFLFDIISEMNVEFLRRLRFP